jgi:hypothetical protein
MKTRPKFAPLPSILELCEALAFAAAQCMGMDAMQAAESLLVRHVKMCHLCWFVLDAPNCC